MLLSIHSRDVLHFALALLPVLLFLAALRALDSYKLVSSRTVLASLVAGALAAGLSFAFNTFVFQRFPGSQDQYAHFGAPVVEESAKAVYWIFLITTARVAFMADSAICGFAVGAGFATVENLYYLSQLTDPNMTVWIVRGFGTAILHGGVQAIFAALVLSNADQRGKLDARTVLPPLALAVLIHAAFNQFVLSPIQETLLVLVSIPPVMLFVFMRSERAVEGWIGAGFDADGELIELLDSGTFSQSNAGKYLYALRARFPGEVVADLLCYLRLYVELALRAKGILMMRENGIEPAISEETREKLQEMRYLESNVGPTALRTLQPLMHMSRRDLWQLYMLGK